jgi:hypothetical protein
MVHLRIAPALALALGALACSSEEDEKPKTPQGPFAVSDYFSPTGGAMGDAENGLVTPNPVPCKTRPPEAQGSCYVFEYTAGAELWAGLYWQYPTNNWGESPGLAVPGNKLSKVTFQAAVQEGTEEMIFVIGGIGVDRPAEAEMFPNTDQMKGEETFTVTTDWQAFEIALPKQAVDGVTPITELLGAFAWFAAYPTNTDYTTASPKTVFIDDLAYE